MRTDQGPPTHQSQETAADSADCKPCCLAELDKSHLFVPPTHSTLKVADKNNCERLEASVLGKTELVF